MKRHEMMAGTNREKISGRGVINLIRGQLINQNRDPRENPRKILIDKAINLMSQNAPIPTTAIRHFRSPLSAELLIHCVLIGRTQRAIKSKYIIYNDVLQ